MDLSSLIRQISIDLAWIYVKNDKEAPKGKTIIMGPRGGYKYNAIRGTKSTQSKPDKNIGKYSDGIIPNEFIRIKDGFNYGFDYHVKKGLFGAGKFSIYEIDNDDGKTTYDVVFESHRGWAKIILSRLRSDKQAQSAVQQMASMKSTDPSNIVRNNKTGEIYITGNDKGSPILDHKKFNFGEGVDPNTSEEAWEEGNDYMDTLSRKYPFATITHIEKE